MPFADPHACPSCGGAIVGENRCSYCRFDLRSPASLQLWQTLLRADSLLAEAQRLSWPESAPAANPAPLPVPGPQVPTVPPVPRPPQPPPVPKAPRWSTGSILLGLGALCLLVAALVFITVSWDALGPTGRTLVLLVVTAAIAAAATWSTRARLRGSAEALWAVFFGFFAIDFFAARAYGLLGLDALSEEHAALLFGVLAAALGGGVAVASRKTITVTTPSIVAGLAVWTASFSLGAALDGPFFWRGFAALALAAAAAAIASRLSLTLIAWFAVAATAVLYVVAAGAAIEEMVESPHLSELAGDGHGVPMLVMIALTAAVGAAAPRLTMPVARLVKPGAGWLAFAPSEGGSPLTISAATLVTLGAASLVFVPSEAAAPHEGGFLAASALAVALAVAFLRGANDWVRGARITSAVILAALAAGSLGWLGNAVDAVGEANESGFGTSWTIRLANTDALPGPGWLAFVVFAAIAATVAAMLRWPEVRAFAQPVAPLPMGIAGLGLVLGVIAYEPLVLVAALLVLALGVGMLGFARTDAVATDSTGKDPAAMAREVWLGAAILTIAIPAAMTLASKPVTLLVWLAVAAVMAAVAGFVATEWARMAGSFGAAALAIGATTLGAEMGSLGDVGVHVVTVVSCALALAFASFVLRDFVGRPEVEAAAGVGVVGVLLAGVELTLGSQALVWTIAGAALVVLGLLVADRHWFRYPGSAALGVAWVLRLAASDVDTVEAYTAPFAVVLLGAGLVAMRRDPQLRTAVALSPGLTLALVPSIPQALADPTGLRALLLGLAATVVLGIGIWRRWQMPVLFGSAVLALLVVWNVGPLANGLPRWILFALAGVVLVGSGITWESRVRNAKSAAQYVQDLR